MKLNNVQFGNAWELAKNLPDESIDCIVTSPPYWGLRDYDTDSVIFGGDKNCEHEWGEQLPEHHKGQVAQTKWKHVDSVAKAGNNGAGNFCLKCNAWKGQFGLEPTPELYVKHLVELFAELNRALKPEGTVWVNLGDSYWGGKGRSNQCNKDKQKQRLDNKETINKEYHQIAGKGKTRPQDGTHEFIKPKDLVGIPWMFALAMRNWGWYLRRDIVWAKGVSGQNDIARTVNNWLIKNSIELPPEMIKSLEKELFVGSCMPESVKDRCTTSHEYIFMFTNSKKYYYDNEAIKEESKYPNDNRKARSKENHKLQPTEKVKGLRDGSAVYKKRNKRSVWCVVPKPYKGAHFAVFCAELIEPCILAGCPENGLVLDPFLGSGTTALVAKNNNRNWIGFELNEEYNNLIKERVWNTF